ncbi:MAG TPA: VCBS repeat-containing protein [Ramlibacter sp.]|uniref:VCBS repeat-containing protein n=1 Tax=Ramlibacter sp. TaxID=1917967 RepID=UPI002ED366F5
MTLGNRTGWVRLRALFTFLAMSLALASALAQSPTFARSDYPFIGHQVVGDFNGDGFPDLAGQAHLVQAVAVRLNNNNGTFGALVEYPLPVAAQDIVAGDFTGDGRLDLVVTHNDPTISVSLLTGRGDGTFAAPVSLPNTSGFDSPDVVAADLNNDGKLDLVLSHNAACFTAPCVIAETISVMLGNGNGTFQPAREIVVGRGTGPIAVGDFNRDGFKDLAIAGSDARVFRLFGVGDGTFIQQPTLTLLADPGFVLGTDIDVADFNRDGIEDLVVAIATNGSRTAILIGNGNGDGTFRTPLILTDPNLNIPQYQAVADYNGDGFLDLALSMGNGLQGLMNIRNGNGDGTFQAPVAHQVPGPMSSAGGADIVAADLNGDGKPDIVLGQSGAFPGLLVLINTTGVPPPPTPAAPTLLSPANDATPGQPVAFDWTDVANATSYEIQVDDSSTFAAPFRANQTVGVSQVSIGGLPAQRLWWRVRARNSAGVFGPFSAARRFTPQAAAPVPATLSAIALNPTSVAGGNTAQATATLTAAAPPGGAVVTLSSSNLGVATLPASATVAAGATSVTFTVSTAPVPAPTLVTITGAFGGNTRSASLTVTPPPPPPPPVTPSSLSVSPATVEGGASVVGTIFLSAGAPTGGLVVALTSSDTTAATVPATTTIFLSSGTFPITTLAAPTNRTTTITATANGVSRTATLTVLGTAAPPLLSTLTVNPTTVTGGTSSQGTVGLTSAAPAGGFAVSLSSNNIAATVPASVSVAQGSATASFTIGTSTVTFPTPVTLTASAAGVTRTASLTVTPAAQTATVTVTATGRSGERVTSSPAGINVSVGSSGSASFNTGTSLVLSVSNGRDAIWSGACSSGGNKARTCTFTVNGSASVSANVQ